MGQQPKRGRGTGTASSPERGERSLTKADGEWVVAELRLLEQMLLRAARKREEQPEQARRLMDGVPRECEMVAAAERLAAYSTETFENLAALVRALLLERGEVPIDDLDSPAPPAVRPSGDGLADVYELGPVQRSLRPALP